MKGVSRDALSPSSVRERRWGTFPVRPRAESPHVYVRFGLAQVLSNEKSVRRAEIRGSS
jgi:hypothetical protein